MEQKGRSHIPRGILASAFLLSLAMWGPMFCVPPMEYILTEQLGLTHAQASLIYSAPLLMVAAFAIPGGILADRIGVRKAAGIGAIIIAVGTALRATATDASSLLAFTLIYGVGFGLVFPNLPKLVSTWVTREESTIATGIFNAGMPTGGALAMGLTIPVFFPITHTFQGAFLIWSIPPIAAAILWWTLVKEPPRTVPQPAPAGARTSFREVLKNRSLWLVAALLGLNEFFFLNWAGWAPSLLTLRGATPALAGLVTSLTLWVVIPTILLMPRLSFRMGLKKPFLWVPSIILTLAALAVTKASPSAMPFLMAAVGVSNATRFITLLSLPCDLVPPERVGAASGLVLAIGYVAGGLGPMAGGRILDMTGSPDRAFLFLVWIGIAATVVAFRLPETGHKRPGCERASYKGSI